MRRENVGDVTDIIEVGDILYYFLNPSSKMDVPSSFYERIEREQTLWVESGMKISFLDYCKAKLV